VPPKKKARQASGVVNEIKGESQTGKGEGQTGKGENPLSSSSSSASGDHTTFRGRVRMENQNGSLDYWAA